MKIQELRKKSEKELRELLQQTTKKITESAYSHHRTPSKNVKEIKNLRQMRARIHTLLKEKIV